MIIFLTKWKIKRDFFSQEKRMKNIMKDLDELQDIPSKAKKADELRKVLNELIDNHEKFRKTYREVLNL